MDMSLNAVQACLYTAVGLGVLTFQHAQAQRQELARALRPARDAIDERRKLVEERLSDVLQRA